MTGKEFEAVIASRTYDFLRTDPHLDSRVMFLTLGGSHAYGTNVEGSDFEMVKSLEDRVKKGRRRAGTATKAG